MSKFTWNKTKLAQVERNITEAMMSLAQDTAHQAQIGAPVDSGALVNSIRVQQSGDRTVLILAGGTAGGYHVPYARRREFENRKNPGKRYYMKNAFEWAQKNRDGYFKGITK